MVVVGAVVGAEVGVVAVASLVLRHCYRLLCHVHATVGKRHRPWCRVELVLCLHSNPGVVVLT